MLSKLQATGALVTPNAPLARRAFWRVGGPAEYLVEVNNLDQLRAVLEFGPVTVLGRGSNTLIHDDGIPGVCVVLKGELAEARIEGTRVRAGAGLFLNALLSRLDRAGLAGAEAFAGVPGTVGGAVIMNAGTSLGEAGDFIESVTVLMPDGEVVEIAGEDCGFAYRHSALPTGVVVAFATLSLQVDDGSRAAIRREFLQRRKLTQPLSQPSCGSTFTNPPGDYAARLIQEAGLKGHTIGGAQISEKHANFFVNLGDATAEDLRQLIVHARRVVLERFGVRLTPEVKLLGPWPDDALSV
jgi:UDP-N-acetylmuramate dehydrogenase